LGAPWHVERWDILVVVHHSSQQKLVICHDSADHVASITLKTAIQLVLVGFIEFFTLILDDFCIRVPFADLELGWFFGRLPHFMGLALCSLV